jgi:hypothetical protein
MKLHYAIITGADTSMMVESLMVDFLLVGGQGSEVIEIMFCLIDLTVRLVSHEYSVEFDARTTHLKDVHFAKNKYFGKYL